eukprot:Colp12_sorted_trinity150504_noHs@27948
MPLFILIAGLTPKEAVPLSQATVFGGAIANMILYLPQGHPTLPNKSLVDFDAVLVLEPMLLMGTVVGVILNQIFPDWLIVTMLALVLMLTAVRTIQKGLKAYKQENLQRQKALEPPEAEATTDALSSEEKKVGMPANAQEIMRPVFQVQDYGAESDEDEDLLERQRKASFKHRLGVPLLLVGLVWVLNSVFAVVGGAKRDAASVAGVHFCSTPYWVLMFGSFPFLLIIMGIVIKRLLHDFKYKMRGGYEFHPQELKWDPMKLRSMPLVAGLAGMLGGMLGIGGGMFIGPLLLELGMASQAIAATSALTVMVTSATAVLQYLLLGMLMVDYGFWHMALGLIATIIGQTAVSYLVKKYN